MSIDSPECAAIWSSALLLLGSCLGDYAVFCTRKAHEMSPKFCAALALGDYRATIRALMLAAALLALASAYPQHELHGLPQASESGTPVFFEVLFQAARAVLGPIAILLLIFVPVHRDYYELCDRLKDPRYSQTPADVALVRANSWQMHFHLVGGAMAFVLSPLVEAFACTLALWRGWPARAVAAEVALPTAVWLGLMLVRMVALTAIVLSSIRMNFEMWFSTAWHQNPLRGSLPEQHVIQNSMRHLQVVGLSMWFVDADAFGRRSGSTRILAILLTAAIVLRLLQKLVKHVYIAVCMNSAFSDERLRRRVEYLREKQAEDERSASSTVQNLVRYMRRRLPGEDNQAASSGSTQVRAKKDR